MAASTIAVSGDLGNAYMQAVSHTSSTVRTAGFSLIASSGPGPGPPAWQINSVAEALRDTQAPPVRSTACKAAAHLLNIHQLDISGGCMPVLLLWKLCWPGKAHNLGLCAGGYVIVAMH